MKIVRAQDFAMHKPLTGIWGGREQKYYDTIDRVLSICCELESVFPGNDMVDASADPDEMIDAVHETELVDFIKRNDSERIVAWEEAPGIISRADEAVSLSHGTYAAARSSASAALTGAELVLEGEDVVYALTRPPGHHASIGNIGGFCFFNNAAVAATRLMEDGKKVFVLDIDLHHGNGTQEILYGNPLAFYSSIHAADEYPGIERGLQYFRHKKCNVHNIVLGDDSSEGQYLHFVWQAVDRFRSEDSDVLLVSAGFDTSENELDAVKEVATFGLSRRCFYDIGKVLKTLRVPVLAVQEGGYNPASLGKDVCAFLQGLSE